MNANCAACNEMPSLTEILRNCGRADKMEQARLLLLCMQRRFSSLRFNPTCNCEKAGDVVEATGGILFPWRLSARVVVRKLAHLFGLTQDDVLEAVEAMGALARQCNIFYAQICRSELDEDALETKPLGNLENGSKSDDSRRRQATDDRRQQTTPCGVWEFCF